MQSGADPSLSRVCVNNADPEMCSVLEGNADGIYRIPTDHLETIIEVAWKSIATIQDLPCSMRTPSWKKLLNLLCTACDCGHSGSEG